MALYQIPDPKENNVWYSYTGSDTVIIFLHGIFSDSRGCWLYEAPSKRAKSTSLLQPVPAANTVYWPELVRTDPAFKGVDIFLAGFYTSIESHDYDLVQCALEVYEALNMARAPAAEAVMAKDNLIFLGHSTGGIVARYVLERNQIPFREKKVGVVLIASPSAGSIYANWFDFLSKIYKNELGGLLTEGNTILAELDSRFSDMVYKKSEHIPHLIGREACENHMVLRRKIFGRFNRFIPPIRRVVEPASAWKYFGQGRMLPDTDHFSSVKPYGVKHPAHELLQSFWTEFQNAFLKTVQTPIGAPKIATRPVLIPPRPPHRIAGRDSVIAEMKKRLLAGGSHALLGPRHTGKRAIALELVYDEELRQAYPDGVLWSDLREEGSAGAELASWADALGISRNTISALKRPQDRAVAVAQSIGQRRMLLVATECGLPAEAILFQLAGPNCAHLLTTHSAETAKAFAGNSPVLEIQYLSDDEALQILEQYAPSLTGQRNVTRPFVQSLGGVPGRVLMFARMLGSGPAEALQTLELLKSAAREGA